MHNLSDFMAELGLSNQQLTIGVHASYVVRKGNRSRSYLVTVYDEQEESNSIYFETYEKSIKEAFEKVYEYLGIKC